jgi:hypothetical protein
MKEIKVELRKRDLLLSALQENILNENEWKDKKDYNLLCGAETEKRGRNVTHCSAKNVSPMQWDLIL